MKYLYLFVFMLFSLTISAQQKVTKLQYAKTLIELPAGCTANSEYEFDCNGFNGQWLFLSEEMVTAKVHEKFFQQIEEQLKFKQKTKIDFLSQNQQFSGFLYNLKSGKYKIVAFGRVNNMPLILNLGFETKPSDKIELTDFQKNFITFK